MSVKFVDILSDALDKRDFIVYTYNIGVGHGHNQMDSRRVFSAVR